MGGSGGFPGGIWGFTGGSGGFPGGGRLHAGQQGLSGGPPGVPCLSPLRDGCPQSTPGTPKGPAPPRGAQGQAGVVGGGGGVGSRAGTLPCPPWDPGCSHVAVGDPKGQRPCGWGGEVLGGGGGGCRLLPAVGPGAAPAVGTVTGGTSSPQACERPIQPSFRLNHPKTLPGPKRGWGDPRGDGGTQAYFIPAGQEASLIPKPLPDPP